MLRYKRKAGLAFIAVGNDEASKIYLKKQGKENVNKLEYIKKLIDLMKMYQMMKYLKL